MRERVARSSARCEQLQVVQQYSRCAFAGTMQSLRAQDAPGSGRPSGGRGGRFDMPMLSAAPASAAAAAERAQVSTRAMAELQLAASSPDAVEAAAAIESARAQLASAGHTWALRGAAGALEASALVAGAGGDEGGMLHDLLADLRTEPADDADRTRRFALYEVSHLPTLLVPQHLLVPT